MKIEERRTHASRRIGGACAPLPAADYFLRRDWKIPRQLSEKMGAAAKYIPPHRIISVSTPNDGAVIRPGTSIFVMIIDRIVTKKIFSLVIF